MDTYEYDAFGNEFTVSGGSSTPNEFLYCGEQYDSDLGLYYLRARYYNPLTGRFMSRDSFEPKLRNPNGTPLNPKELHKYLYTGGDPVNWIDPRGMEELEEYSFEKDEYTLFQKAAATIAILGIETVFVLETRELEGLLEAPPGAFPPHPAPGNCPSCGEPGMPPTGPPYPPGQKPPITPDPGTFPEEW
jgi:RHS repeat-associated protein